ncbi:tetratricopeptide repeat protein [Streptomyces sp. NBRC 109706]|uniref:tetratricopeptide repeat protein n=1 Tax=Streptomyces sp. NBRC 109706 TaxID=1550035 RepID=UPI0007864076|nr:tetratricopeptide repeat protein [Streptomyces sp. NBRC 109706]
MADEDEEPAGLPGVRPASPRWHRWRDLHNEGTLRLRAGQLDEARGPLAAAYAETQVPDVDEEGLLHRAATATNASGLAEALGDPAEAERLISESVELCADLGDYDGAPATLVNSLIGRAQLLISTDRHTAAGADLDRAFAIADQLPEPGELLAYSLHGARSVLYMVTGELAEAEQEALIALDIALAFRPELAAYPCANLAQIALACDNPEAAEEFRRIAEDPSQAAEELGAVDGMVTVGADDGVPDPAVLAPGTHAELTPWPLGPRWRRAVSLNLEGIRQVAAAQLADADSLFAFAERATWAVGGGLDALVCRANIQMNRAGIASSQGDATTALALTDKALTSLFEVHTSLNPAAGHTTPPTQDTVGNPTVDDVPDPTSQRDLAGQDTNGQSAAGNTPGQATVRNTTGQGPAGQGTPDNTTVAMPPGQGGTGGVPGRNAVGNAAVSNVPGQDAAGRGAPGDAAVAKIPDQSAAGNPAGQGAPDEAAGQSAAGHSDAGRGRGGALPQAHALPQAAALVQARQLRAAMLRELGRLGEGLEELGRIEALLPSLGDGRPTAEVWWRLLRASLLMASGRFAEADDEGRRALALAQEHAPWLAARVHVMLAEHASTIGDYETSATRLRLAGELFAALDETEGQVAALVSLGRLEYLAGRPEEARRHYDRAEALLPAAGAAQVRAACRHGQAAVAVSSGRPEEALALLEQSHAEWGETRTPLVEIAFHQVAGSAHAALENHAEAERCLLTARRLGQEHYGWHLALTVDWWRAQSLINWAADLPDDARRAPLLDTALDLAVPAALAAEAARQFFAPGGARERWVAMAAAPATRAALLAIRSLGDAPLGVALLDHLAATVSLRLDGPAARVPTVAPPDVLTVPLPTPAPLTDDQLSYAAAGLGLVTTGDPAFPAPRLALPPRVRVAAEVPSPLEPWIERAEERYGFAVRSAGVVRAW